MGSPVVEIAKMRIITFHSCAFGWPSFFTVYHPQDDDIAMVDRIAERIDDICGDFNIFHKEGNNVRISP